MKSNLIMNLFTKYVQEFSEPITKRRGLSNLPINNGTELGGTAGDTSIKQLISSVKSEIDAYLYGDSSQQMQRQMSLVDADKRPDDDASIRNARHRVGTGAERFKHRMKHILLSLLGPLIILFISFQVCDLPIVYKLFLLVVITAHIVLMSVTQLSSAI